MFKINDTIVYPIYGCGKIKNITKEKIGNELIDYFELDFADTNINISIPMKQAEQLGVRKPMKKDDLKSALKTLWKKVELDKEDQINMESIARDHLNTGLIEDAVKLINMIKASEKTKNESNKVLSFSDEHNLQIAINFVRTEVEHVLGKKYAKEIKLNKKA